MDIGPSHKSTISSQKSPVTSHQSPVINHQSPVTRILTLEPWRQQTVLHIRYPHQTSNTPNQTPSYPFALTKCPLVSPSGGGRSATKSFCLELRTFLTFVSLPACLPPIYMNIWKNSKYTRQSCQDDHKPCIHVYMYSPISCPIHDKASVFLTVVQFDSCTI